MRCWGLNSNGQVMLLGFVFEMQGCACSLLDLISRCELPQLGDGSTTNRFSPVEVAGLSSGVSSVSLGWVRLTFALFAVAARDYSQPLLVFFAACVFDCDDVRCRMLRTCTRPLHWDS